MTVEDFVKGKVIPNFVEVGGDKEAAFDIATVLTFIQIAKEVISLLQDCKKAKEVPETAKNPTLMQRIVLRGKIKEVLGTRGFLRHGRATVDGFLKAGAKLTEDEVQSLYDEV
jgi:hypothetical protein